MISAGKLKESYLDWVAKSYEYSQLNSKTVRIDTPFSDKFSDDIVIYAIEDANEIVLTDDGWTLDGLESMGVEINKSSKRKELLERQLNFYGIKLNDGELFIKSSKDNIGVAKHRLLQAILFVNDMFMLSRANTSTVFLEDVNNYFIENKIRMIRDASYVGKSGLTHKFEFNIPGFGEEIPQRLIKVMSQENNSMYAKSILMDVIQTREIIDDKTNFYVFVNDFKNNKIVSPNEEIINLFQYNNVIPVMYSKKEQFIEEFQK